MCVGVLAAPIGVSLLSHYLPPLLAEATPPPDETTPLSEEQVQVLLGEADRLYDGNQMRDGLELLTKYEDMEEVEVRGKGGSREGGERGEEGEGG